MSSGDVGSFDACRRVVLEKDVPCPMGGSRTIQCHDRMAPLIRPAPSMTMSLWGLRSRARWTHRVPSPRVPSPCTSRRMKKRSRRRMGWMSRFHDRVAPLAGPARRMQHDDAEGVRGVRWTGRVRRRWIRFRSLQGRWNAREACGCEVLRAGRTSNGPTFPRSPPRLSSWWPFLSPPHPSFVLPHIVSCNFRPPHPSSLTPASSVSLSSPPSCLLFLPLSFVSSSLLPPPSFSSPPSPTTCTVHADPSPQVGIRRRPHGHVQETDRGDRVRVVSTV
ncbi:hypothetical protein B0H12DRAFT_785575 [Mycena haematopus]|nr:hypothetical protein B0H12DRAFT_785575 [Mycena haematopus]